MDFEEGNCGGYYMMMTPNPTSGETTISIESENTGPTLKSAGTENDFDDSVEWEYEIYSPSQHLKTQKTNLKGKSTRLQTNGWTEGIYTVRAKYKNEIITGKLVVKK